MSAPVELHKWYLWTEPDSGEQIKVKITRPCSNVTNLYFALTYGRRDVVEVFARDLRPV